MLSADKTCKLSKRCTEDTVNTRLYLKKKDKLAKPGTLSGKELVRMGCLAKPIKKERQIVMIIELFNFNFPGYSVSFCVMFQCDREIAALVKLAEGGGAALALLEGPGQGRPDDRGIAHVRLEATFKH